MLCRSCTAGHHSAGGGQLLPGPTMALVPVSISVILYSDSYHRGFFFTDVLMLRDAGLQHGHHPFFMGVHFSSHPFYDSFQTFEILHDYPFLGGICKVWKSAIVLQ
jgi:hypothetical protein